MFSKAFFLRCFITPDYWVKGENNDTVIQAIIEKSVGKKGEIACKKVPVMVGLLLS